MKIRYGKEQDIIADRFLKLPVIQKYEVTAKRKDGFLADVELEDGYEFVLSVFVMEEAYPSLVKDKIQNLSRDKENENIIIMAPYISEITAKICEENGAGFFDYAGNCLFCKHSVYICEKGNKNKHPQKRGQQSVFERSAEVSSMILRELFQDLTRTWRLMHLAEAVGCSIGQVSKVKEFLCRNMWAEMTGEGLRITQPEQMLEEWGRVYGKKTPSSCACYSLDGIADFEKKLVNMKKQTGIDYYLTGFSGGVKYVPVVRYNRVHVYIEQEDIREAMRFLDCKEVASGQNIIIFPIEDECCVKNAEIRNGYSVVSSVQIYLDCIQLKGRGEEIAEAVMRREILSHDKR